MKLRKPGQIKLLAHEGLVSVSLYGKQVVGYAFGKHPLDGIVVCLAKPELTEAGLTCNGPCLNKFFPYSMVKFLDRKLAVQIEEKDEEQDEPIELDTNTGSDSNDNNSGDILDEKSSKKKPKKKVKQKTKKGK
jgi:hypothetical protein